MKVERLVVGDLYTNSYIAYDENKKDGIVIDPGGNPNDIIARLKQLLVNLKYIVFTHVHFDHILAYPYISKEYSDAKLIVSHLEKEALYDRNLSLLNYVGEEFPVIRDYIEVKDGDLIEFGKTSLKVIETPGHTKGSISLYSEGVLFSGDTLFLNSIGRYDFPGGSLEKELYSIKEILFKLPCDTVVFPGHGDKTTIGFEIENNEIAGIR